MRCTVGHVLCPQIRASALMTCKQWRILLEKCTDEISLHITTLLCCLLLDNSHFLLSFLLNRGVTVCGTMRVCGVDRVSFKLVGAWMRSSSSYSLFQQQWRGFGRCQWNSQPQEKWTGTLILKVPETLKVVQGLKYVQLWTSICPEILFPCPLKQRPLLPLTSINTRCDVKWSG